MKTHQIKLTPGEYAAIVKHDETDYVQLLRPESERVEVGDILHLREFMGEAWGYSPRCCYRLVVSVVKSPRAIDANAGRMVGLVLNVWFGERVGLQTEELTSPPVAVEFMAAA